MMTRAGRTATSSETPSRESLGLWVPVPQMYAQTIQHFTTRICMKIVCVKVQVKVALSIYWVRLWKRRSIQAVFLNKWVLTATSWKFQNILQQLAAVSLRMPTSPDQEYESRSENLERYSAQAPKATSSQQLGTYLFFMCPLMWCKYNINVSNISSNFPVCQNTTHNNDNRIPS